MKLQHCLIKHSKNNYLTWLLYLTISDNTSKVLQLDKQYFKNVHPVSYLNLIHICDSK